jgi:hypothetical protein
MAHRSPSFLAARSAKKSFSVHLSPCIYRQCVPVFDSARHVLVRVGHER